MTDAKDAVLEYLRHIGAGLDPDFLREAIKVMTALLMESVIRLEGSVLLEIDDEWQVDLPVLLRVAWHRVTERYIHHR